MQRVMIIGQPGSGKSTLARMLGQATGLPVVHIDLIHWKPGWVERSKEQKTKLCDEVAARDAWIFEGGHSRTWPHRLERCDTLIWLDYPVHVRLWRVISRTIRHWGQSRPDLPDDCPERFEVEFFRWIWDTRKTSRRQMAKLVETAPDAKTVHVFRSFAQVNAFVKSVAR